MITESFNEGIAELLEVDSVNDLDVIESFEAWDSLTSLSIIVFIDENYNVSLFAKEIVDARTIGGLKSLVLSKLKQSNEM